MNKTVVFEVDPELKRTLNSTKEQIEGDIAHVNRVIRRSFRALRPWKLQKQRRVRRFLKREM